jgi:hypothetical protein
MRKLANSLGLVINLPRNIIINPAQIVNKTANGARRYLWRM